MVTIDNQSITVGESLARITRLAELSFTHTSPQGCEAPQEITATSSSSVLNDEKRYSDIRSC